MTTGSTERALNHHVVVIDWAFIASGSLTIPNMVIMIKEIVTKLGHLKHCILSGPPLHCIL